MKNESKDKYNLPRGLWWRETTGRIALCRCPKCGRENYCMNVLSGICTWCGFDANSYYNNDNKSMKLTKNEQWILDYLKGKDYVSPTVIGKSHASVTGSAGFTHHSSWASPICLRLVKKGLLVRNEKGHYKLNADEK